MSKIFSSIISIFILFLIGCKSPKRNDSKIGSKQNPQQVTLSSPNYNYSVDYPKDWIMYDSSIEGLKVRFIKAPSSLNHDNPIVNIFIAFMNEKSLDNFTTSNINYLEKNMTGVILLKRGTIDTSINNGQWFTYTKEQNGTRRDMINYIIAVNGYAYMITCGTNKGSMNKYRLNFDKIAKSLKY